MFSERFVLKFFFKFFLSIRESVLVKSLLVNLKLPFVLKCYFRAENIIVFLTLINIAYFLFP
jgi:hypothetical protein